jgi:hypothetical protein
VTWHGPIRGTSVERMHLNASRRGRAMPRREQGFAVGAAAVVLDVLACVQAVGDPREDDGRG